MYYNFLIRLSITTTRNEKIGVVSMVALTVVRTASRTFLRHTPAKSKEISANWSHVAFVRIDSIAAMLTPKGTSSVQRVIIDHDSNEKKKSVVCRKMAITAAIV